MPNRHLPIKMQFGCGGPGPWRAAVLAWASPRRVRRPNDRWRRLTANQEVRFRWWKWPILWLSISLGFGGGWVSNDGSAAYAQPPHIDEEESDRLRFFEAKIRPVLVQHCLECHGDSTVLQGGLSLETRDAWLRGGDSGPAIVPGAPEESLLWQAVSYRDSHLEMPPDGQLPANVLADLQRWIADGAYDPRTAQSNTADAPLGKPDQSPIRALAVADAQQHWAYRPLTPVDVSPARHQGQHPIDWLLHAAQVRAGITPVEVADARQRWRRLHLDLAGRLPTYEALQNLPSDPTQFADAYTTEVDRLLAEVAYGEVLARLWMDVVRYADSITLRGFVLPQAWRYRDYLIDSFHADRPFSQMIVEQLAGDLLPPPTAEDSARDSDAALKQHHNQLVATTFLTLGNTNLETQDKRLLELDYIDEQLDVIGQAFLGQTISCARCHDHKFDPIPTRDYYALAGILDGAIGLKHDNVSTWVELPLPLGAAQEAERQQLQRQLTESAETLRGLRAALPAKLAERRGIPVAELDGVVVDDQDAEFVGDWLESQHTAPYVGTGYRHDRNQQRGEKSATFQPAGLAPGEYEVRLSYSAGENRATTTLVDVFSAAGQTSVLVNQRQPPPEDGLWYSLGTFRFETDGQAYVMISNQGADGHVMADAVQFLPVPIANRASGAASDSGATEAVTTSEQDRRQALESQIQELESQRRHWQQQLDQQPKYMTVVSKPTQADLPILIRGNHQMPSSIAPRGFLSAVSLPSVSSIPAGADGRLALARWIAAEENPLTARVYVNRLWAWLMGAGLVTTPNEFGTMGAMPTHPELLDWLAAEFHRSGGSTKHIVRLIVTSAAYQRRVESTPQLATMDPDNRLYARGHRRRLSAEALRDQMLRISGELDETVGGSTIAANTVTDYQYEHRSLRQSIYQPVFRNALPDLFAEFDFADPSRSVGRRSRSTVSTQALALWNSPWVTARANATAARVRQMALANTTANQDAMLEVVRLTYQHCLQRDPTGTELTRCLAFLSEVAEPNDLPGRSSDAVEPADSAYDPLVDLVQALFASLEFRYLDLPPHISESRE